MGIKHLWTILTPFGERKPLYELEGKTVAVDLSCWICEAQNITDYYVQPKMYLRNLYFRTCYLLLMGVHPVFVLEGKAPEMKYDTIAARNALQFKGAKPRAASKQPKEGKDRTRFNFVLRCCEEMLGYMGLACVKGSGEAEALCAYLDQDGLVDGCISQDSDCFAYGAQVVYRNFSISQQGHYAASGGAVDVYDIRQVCKSIKFGRNKIIALALLCGSDYSDGVFGVGKEAAMKLFEIVSDEEILDRLRSWKSNTQLYDEYYRKLNDKNICTSCGHFGKTQAHTKSGCRECGTSASCDSSRFKERRLEIKNEVAMRSKAIADPSFPNEQLVEEFLEKKDNVRKLDLKWKKPDLIKFVKFTKKHLQWEELYAFEKFLPIFTRWQLLNTHTSTDEGGLTPDHIKKARKPKGVPSYEIVWSDKESHYGELIPESQLNEVDQIKLWSTIEPQDLVAKCYPNLVDAFQRSKIKPKKPSKRKVADKMEDIENKLANTSISEPKPKQRKCKKKPPVQSKKIDSYFKTALMNNARLKEDERTGTVLKETNDVFDLDLSKFGDESDLDVSDVIDEILSRSPPRYIQEHLGKLLQTREDDDVSETNKSSFFITETTENDLFEQSMNQDTSSSDEEEDSFSDDCLPLIERLKLKSLTNSNILFK